MLRLLPVSLLVIVAACGSKSFPSVCTLNPPPTGCSATCNAKNPIDTCPAGFYCNSDGKCDAECTQGGSQCGMGYICTADGKCESSGDCQDLSCKVADCKGMNKPPTTISGTVYAPNGSLPLYGISVYVPDTDPGPMTDGVSCQKCSDSLPGNPIGAPVTTDEMGHFTLTNVPSGQPVPVIITSGKWRRIITLPTVMPCTDNPVATADTTLPKSHDDVTANTKLPPEWKSSMTEVVHLPQIAISTGHADALECLIRKLGVADKEITTDTQGGRVHLFADNGSPGVGTNSFQGGFGGGNGNFTDSKMLWGSVSKLKNYDIVIFSCEGGQYPETKSQMDMDQVKMYADLGGRMFMSHWHNVWIAGAGNSGQPQGITPWEAVATWSYGGDPGPGTVDTIDEQNNPKGPSFAQWMLNVQASPMRDQIPIQDGTAKQTCQNAVNGKAERWVYLGQAATGFTQNFQFTTPQEADANSRCGKVVFSDMHVSGDSSSATGKPYPSGCSSMPLTPQEKALAFMFFDISSCVGTIF